MNGNGCQNHSTPRASNSLPPPPRWGQRQHTAAWRPVRVNPVARQQFTDEGRASGWVLHCCPHPCLSFVIIVSTLNLPGLELLIWFFFPPAEHQHFAASAQPEMSEISCLWPLVCCFLTLVGKVQPTLLVVERREKKEIKKRIAPVQPNKASLYSCIYSMKTFQDKRM